MNDTRYDVLKLENQLCFPLYAASREIIKRYRPYLDALELTYTQYLALMVLWETETVSAKVLGEKLFLDSGTLTPVLKSLAEKGLIHRCRSREDERVLMLSLTEKGAALKEQAVAIPGKIAGCVNLSPEDARALYRLIYKLLHDTTTT